MVEIHGAAMVDVVAFSRGGERGRAERVREDAREEWRASGNGLACPHHK